MCHCLLPSSSGSVSARCKLSLGCADPTLDHKPFHAESTLASCCPAGKIQAPYALDYLFTSRLLITFPVTLCLPITWTGLHSKNRLCMFLPRDLCKYCDSYLERPCLSLYPHVLSVSDQMSIPVALPLGKASLILLRTDRCPQMYPHHSTYTT